MTAETVWMETLASLATSFMVTLVGIGGENFTASSANMKLHVNVHVSPIKCAVNRLQAMCRHTLEGYAPS